MMTHTYYVSGMTCGGCQAKVQGILSKLSGVRNVSIDLEKGEATIEMDKLIATDTFKEALKDFPKYQIADSKDSPQIDSSLISEEEIKPWVETYKPILLIFGYIIGISLMVEYMNGRFVWMRWMTHFMAGFFLVFSFFKLLNLKAFADSYSMYDIVAKRWKGWGYAYALTELALGVAFLTGFNPIITNAVTFVVMTISSVGVFQSVANKRKIKCACLGAVFNLPMSTVTIIEDLLMIGMSGVVLLMILL